MSETTGRGSVVDRTTLARGLSVGAVGLVAGVVAGWIGLLSGDGARDVVRVATDWYLALGAVFVIVLIALVRHDVDMAEPWRFVTIGGALAHVVVAAAVGWTLGNLLFVVGTAQIPAVFGDEQAPDVVDALYDGIGWGRALVLASITGVAALVLAVWGHRRVARG